MLRRIALTAGLLGACVWCLVMVARATGANAPPTATARADQPAGQTALPM
ncbi:MAG TPA: hypothetical protein VM243_02280 [Phycisphaerae bacterium]|nr:hypothetical protein [Phycisphaerae bacterium]